MSESKRNQIYESGCEMITVSENKVNLVKLVKTAYELSRPQGLGFLSFEPGPLSDGDAESLVLKEGCLAVDLDYVYGRSCKLHVRRENGNLVFPDRWHDHTDKEYDTLLKEVGVK